MNILGRPYVFGDPEQSEWIRREYWREDLRNKIVEGLQQALDGIDEYVYAFTPDKDLHSTLKDAVDKLNYTGGLIWNKEIEAEWNKGEFLIRWVTGKEEQGGDGDV